MENKGNPNEEINQNEPKKNKINILKILKITWKIVEKLIVVAIIIISAIIITQNVTGDKQSFLGYKIYRVLTGSMQPEYLVGDVILVKETPIDKIKVGDDVTYVYATGSMKGNMVTHRVIDIETIEGKKAFHTQGIANPVEDPIIYGEQISGVVQYKLYVVTAICRLLVNGNILYFGVVLPLTIYIFFAFYRSKIRKHENGDVE